MGNRVGRFMAFLVVVVALSVCGAGIALSQTLSLDDQTATMVEEEVIFTLSIDYPSSESGRIGSVTIDVKFDHNVLTFDPPEYSREDGEPYPLHGPLFANWAALDVSNPSDGQLKVVGFTIGGLQPGASGEIVQLPFIVNAMDKAELTISAQDALATFSTQNGQFTFELPPANNLPMASDDMGTTEQGQSVMIDVLANDEDMDGDSLTITAVTQGDDGTVAITGNGATVTYTPNTGYTGDYDEFTYTVSDGTDTDLGTVTVTVMAPSPPANNAPVAMDDTADTDEDESVVINVLANDDDADGDTLTVTMATEPSDGEAVVCRRWHEHHLHT